MTAGIFQTPSTNADAFISRFTYTDPKSSATPDGQSAYQFYLQEYMQVTLILPY